MGTSIYKCSIAHLEHSPNIQELINEYAEECAIEGLPHPLAKAETYKQLESTGWLHAYAAYADYQLVGFIVVLVSVLPHYSVPVATVESFFVTKSQRKSGAGLKLRRAAEEYARQKGSPGMLISAPVGSALASALSITKGYVETNRVFFKRFV